MPRAGLRSRDDRPCERCISAVAPIPRIAAERLTDGEIRRVRVPDGNAGAPPTKEEPTIRPALTIIGTAVGAVCALPAFAIMLFFLPLAGGAGALILLIGALWVLAYLAAGTAMLAWIVLTRGARVLVHAGRRASRPRAERSASGARLTILSAGKHWRPRHP